jgi:hypothetical protein
MGDEAAGILSVAHFFSWIISSIGAVAGIPIGVMVRLWERLLSRKWGKLVAIIAIGIFGAWLIISYNMIVISLVMCSIFQFLSKDPCDFGSGRVITISTAFRQSKRSRLNWATRLRLTRLYPSEEAISDCYLPRLTPGTRSSVSPLRLDRPDSAGQACTHEKVNIAQSGARIACALRCGPGNSAERTFNGVPAFRCFLPRRYRAREGLRGVTRVRGG